jgi:hypothetical protein
MPRSPDPLSALRTPQRRHSLATSRWHAPVWALVSPPVGPHSPSAGGVRALWRLAHRGTGTEASAVRIASSVLPRSSSISGRSWIR